MRTLKNKDFFCVAILAVDLGCMIQFQRESDRCNVDSRAAEEPALGALEK